MSATIRAAALALALSFALAGTTMADVIIGVRPPFSDPPFSITPGYSVSYSPSTAIDLTVPSGFPQPNTDVENDNKFGVSPNYGGTGFTALTSRHVFENSPEVKLTVSVPSGLYQVLVQTFVNTGSNLYGGRYGFVSGQLTAYSFATPGGTLIATGDNGPPGQGQFQIREFDLGVHAALGGQLNFYFDDFDGDSRVGGFVGLRLSPVPEPSSVDLAGLSLLGLLAVGFHRHRAKLRRSG